MSHIIISTAPTYEPFMLYKKEMENIMPFEFEGKQVRVVMKDSTPRFIGKDVCELLSIKNSNDAVGRLLDEEKMVSVLPIAGQNRSFTLVSESGMYALIFTSRKKDAVLFRKWVTSEVLPTIRKTGSYQIKALSPAEMLLQQAQLMVQQEQRLSNVEEDIKKLKASQITSTVEYYTISGYCSLKGLKITPGQANLAGRRASKLSREHDIEVGKVGDSKYGQVNSYHIDILDEVFR